MFLSHRKLRQTEDRQHWSALRVPVEAAGQAGSRREGERRRQAEEAIGVGLSLTIACFSAG